MNDQQPRQRPLRKIADDTSFKWLGLLCILAVAGLLYYKYGGDFSRLRIDGPINLTQSEAPNELEDSQKPREPEESVPLQVKQAPVSQADTSIEALPELDASDAQATRDLASKLKSPFWVRSLGGEELIRKAVAVIDNVSRGDIARKLLTLPTPNERLQLSSPDTKLSLDQQNYARYNQYVEIVVALDDEAVRALYDRFLPLLQQAYTELGNPNSQFTDSLAAAFQLVLDTPEINRPLMLERLEGRIVFVDQEIENLPDIQKLLIRMGPDNRARIKQKVASLQAILF